ncbi:MAG: hypothetical protein Kow0037_11830 [Calditrichia bacterium]
MSLRTHSPIYHFFLLLLVLFFTGAAYGKNSRLELIHADVSRGVVREGVPIRILEGNVQARQDTLELFCDQAIYNETGGYILLKSRVRLLRGVDTLLAKQVKYFEKSQTAVASGNVIVKRPGQKLTADSLTYNYRNDEIHVRGKVSIIDAPKNVWVNSRLADYLPKDSLAVLRENVHLRQVDSTYSDTVHVYCKELRYFSGKDRIATAVGEVHFHQAALHAYGDSAVYFLDREEVILEKGPRAIQENNEITGNSLRLFLQGTSLDRIEVKGNARAVSVDDSTLNKENRLLGKEIVMFFKDKKIRELRAISNARSFYFLKEEEEDRGINSASADTIKALFKNNEVDSIVVIGGAQGIYYPQDYKGPVKER